MSDTIIALATPPGVGAIGVIRLSGPAAIQLVDAVFHGKKLSEQASHTIHFGTIRDEKDQILDEVLVSLFIGPRSYTGEHVVEISCHGSNYIIQELIRLFIRKGARLAQPGEFTMRAFLNGRMDLSQAEAVADLIASNSAAAQQVAIKQLRGGISNEIKKLRQELIDFASLIELELDFGEEDVEFANRDQLRALVQKLLRLIHKLSDSFQLGNAIKEGVNTVIAGRPNAGKSTLLNALLNEDRAIVSEIAGTTRDTIEESLNIQGIQFRIIDTAGIREASDAIEAIGVQKTLEKVRQSAVLIYLFDVIKTQPAELEADLAQLIHDETQLLVVANKMDLNPYTEYKHYANPYFTAEQWIPISAANEMNIEYLKERLYQTVVGQEAGMDGAVVSNARHYEALLRAQTSLEAVIQGLDNAVTTDFVAMDIRHALAYLGEITGEISTEDLLDNIFSRFCIGK
ncbi:MAG: tRNA uridine-5-carboxymethylaminomethyl(34) synthesis GTPase MnmE [Haliscomenobacter sp.]|uniref:tRNA uridine-5-carboxymethylaminomethyl(34) synthesis GTPase MnmE n=1 Tax=Haliscomenobacter sp. TaxID=2717303 RepID=UPI0029A5F2D7|nr:tRNA uridine-5-carboxymethylaminomethyl(34) synthesis GTPase MnmE [Haliscomenobacter sp.]MDX2072648.1 tRNA uridine-5-carboxymethylaminomethyl(34) synthesis GTPase MnmE [Haliscomenobacter sp.]